MPIHGNCQEVAVQFELDQNSGGAWIFGKFCYWIGGKRVGNYELGTSLSDVLTTIPPLVRDSTQRDCIHFFSMPAEALTNELDQGLFGDNANAEQRALEEGWARFIISLPVDIFDDYRIYLIEDDGSGRYLVRNLATRVLEEYRAPRGTFDEVIGKTYAELRKLEEAVRP